MPSGSDFARRLPRVVLALFFPVAVAAYARFAAADESQSAIRWNGQVDFSLMNFDYREYEDGRLLDRESGGIPGVVFHLTGAIGRWDLGGRFSWHAGEVVYDGQTTTGIPIRTHTQENILDTSVRIERRFDSVASPGLALYGGFGYRYWGREIRPTYTSSGQAVDGLFEMYRWKYFFFGGKAAVYRTGRSRWSLDARLLRPYRPTLEVDQMGPYDTVMLALGARTGWRVAVPWEYRLNAHTHWVFEPYAEAWDVGRSPDEPLTQNGVQVDDKTIHEPRSTTRNLGIAVGLRRFF